MSPHELGEIFTSGLVWNWERRGGGGKRGEGLDKKRGGGRVQDMWVKNTDMGVGVCWFYFIFPFFLASSTLSFLSLTLSARFIYQGGEEGKTWDRKDMLSTGLMAMLSGPAIFMGMGVVIATGWAIFMGAEAGMLTEAMLTGPVMVTGCCRLTGDVMFTVLVLMFICAAMVTGWLLLLLLPRFIAVVMGAETVTGVAEAELQTSLLSLLQELKLVCPWVFRWLVM